MGVSATSRRSLMFVICKEPSYDENQNTQANPEGPVFNIQRIYTKDVSFEAPNAPEIFRQEWKPEVNVDLQTKTNRLEDTIYEVVLHLTVTVKMQDKDGIFG